MPRSLAVLGLLPFFACATSPPPTPVPTPPRPVCEAGHGDPGEHYDCWTQPPGEPWQYACAVYDGQYRVVGVTLLERADLCQPPQPPHDECVLRGDPAVSLPGHPSSTELGEAVNQALVGLTSCSVGSTCLLGDRTQQEIQAGVEAELRAQGLCAGQHAVGTDEIAVAHSCSEPWEGFHIFAGDDSDGPVPQGGRRRTVVWYPASYRGAWQAPAGACGP